MQVEWVKYYVAYIYSTFCDGMRDYALIWWTM